MTFISVLIIFCLMCVPFHVVDSGWQGDDLIIMDSISNSQDKCWSGFLYILALSSVISRNIISFCPWFVETRYKALFNKKIEPHIPLKAIPSVDDVYILFCFNGLIKGNFEPNHSNCFQLLNNKIINFGTNERHNLLCLVCPAYILHWYGPVCKNPFFVCRYNSFYVYIYLK